jgi:transposase
VHEREQPSLNQQHAQQRLFLCRQYVRSNYRNIIFSDEKMFEVDRAGVVHWIPYNRPRPTFFRSQIQYRIAIFGAVWYNGRSNLVFIRNRTNTHTFVQYLQSAFHRSLPAIRQYYFVHDHPTWAHTTVSHDWLRRHHIRCLDRYPPVSPDLNPIESVWSWMNHYIQQRNPYSQQNLERLVMDAWN